MNKNEIKEIANSLSNWRLFRKITWSDCGYVDVEKILYNYDIKLKYIDFNSLEGDKNKSVQGACILNKNKYCIYLQYDLKYHRKRYAIAVQLGHIFLKNLDKNIDNDSSICYFNKDVYYKVDNSMNNELIEAIYFAKELLMPKSDIINESKKGICLFLSSIMEIFNVSKMAMINRL